MLWELIRNSMNAFLSWEIYAAGLIYLIMTFGAAMIFVLFSKSGTLLTFYMMFLQPFMHAIATLTFVAIIAPIALGIGSEGAWSLPMRLLTSAPWDVAKAAGILVLVSMGAALVPIIGGLPSFQSLIVGAFALGLIFNLAGVHGISRADMMPSFWLGAGILLIGAVISWVGVIVAALVMTTVSAMFKDGQEEFGAILMFPITATFGFAPLIIYMTWLGMKFG